jgi:type III pantothenate kinase
MQDWLALAIGNSRLHWAWFDQSGLRQTWDTAHLEPEMVRSLIQTKFNFSHYENLLPLGLEIPQWQTHLVDLWLVSVVPEQTALWQQYARAKVLTLADVPLANIYASLGGDRAMALWGAIQTYGCPVLVIDGGTALTLTGANGQADDCAALVGGAIFPGVRSLLQTLKQSTAALPLLDATSFNASVQLPDRWARETVGAIQSGIAYMVMDGLQGFIRDWQGRYPTGAIVFTGGDGVLLRAWLNAQAPAITTIDPNLIFAGIAAVVQQRYRAEAES